MVDFIEIFNVVKRLFFAFGENLFLFFITLLLSLPLGLIICFGSMSKIKIVSAISKFFVWIIRGTPLMLQLFIVLYAPGLLLGIPMKERMVAAVIAFVVNYAAYFSEIYRGGILSVAKGQYEAGQVLGMKKADIFFKIVLPQVIKSIVPPMGNELITLVKDTSLARVIAVGEILKVSEDYTRQGLIWPLFTSGIFFLFFSAFITYLLNFTEKKLGYYR